MCGHLHMHAHNMYMHTHMHVRMCMHLRAQELNALARERGQRLVGGVSSLLRSNVKKVREGVRTCENV